MPVLLPTPKRCAYLRETVDTEPPRHLIEESVGRSGQRRNEGRVAESARRDVARDVAAAIPLAAVVDDFVRL